jgi:hypothetical protein
MFFIHQCHLDLLRNRQESDSVSAGVVIFSPLFWPSSHHAESSIAIYLAAYKHFLAASAPSRFQRSIEPSMN